MKTIAVGIVRLYKICLSPFLPRACVYTPTCSEYAAEAFDKYGVLKGGRLAMMRILRCHPFARGGHDPVV